MAYVDVDVHHGDGVQAAFYDDPGCSPISLHESGYTLFPGTGFPDETGGPGAEGSAVNVALPAGTRDAGWLRAFDAVVPPLLRAFAPDVLVTQHGCDTHATDPLADLLLSVDGQPARPTCACTSSRTRWPAAAGSPSAAAATSWPPWCRGRGRTCSALACHADRSTRAARPRTPGGTWPRAGRRGSTRRRPSATASRRLRPLGRRHRRPRRRAWTGRWRRPGSAVFPLHGLDPLMVER